jgi:hypothetical protein
MEKGGHNRQIMIRKPTGMREQYNQAQHRKVLGFFVVLI